MELEQKRLALHEFLCRILGDRNCYYDPPTGFEMEYPAITYTLASPWLVNADNIPYLMELQWTVTVIDENPESRIVSEFFKMPKCSFDRTITINDLNHFVFSLYF